MSSNYISSLLNVFRRVKIILAGFSAFFNKIISSNCVSSFLNVFGRIKVTLVGFLGTNTRWPLK